MRPIHPTVPLIVVICLAAPLASAQSHHGDSPLDQQISELRQELARTKLALDKALAELESIREFLAEKNLGQKIEQWRAERRALEDERRRVKGERRKLEAARMMLHRTTARQAEQQARAADEAREAAAEARQPKWHVQYMIGLIDKEQEQIYLRVVRGRVVRLRRFANIDTRNVMVRGTFVNRSAAPWRYTFEILIAGDDSFGVPIGEPRLNGKWRYQTPLLGPGDLHQFEVKVPVRDVYDTETVQIANVTADRPALDAVEPASERHEAPRGVESSVR